MNAGNRFILFIHQAAMSELKRNKTDNSFYQELINRFFHSHSYFFVCMKYYLENSSLIKADDITHQILTNVVIYLTESKDAVSELREISKIRGFENTYLALEVQLAQINFRSLQQSQLKKAIQNLALFLLNNLAHLLSEDENRRLNLGSYLQLKIALKQLLKDSNGTLLPQYYEINHSQNVNDANLMNENYTASNFQGKDLTTKDYIDHNDTIKLKNFSNEAYVLLKPLTGFVQQKQESVAQSAFMEQAHTCFYKLLGLAMYTGTGEVEQIAQRVITILEVIRDNHLQLNEYIVELVYRAKTAVQNKTYHLQNSKILHDLLDDYDQYISSLNDQILNRQPKFAQENSLNEAESQVASLEQIESTQDVNGASQQESCYHNQIDRVAGAASIHADQIVENDDNNSQVKFRGEDGNSISGLINEIKSTKASSLTGISRAITDIQENKPDLTMPDSQHVSNNGKDDNYLYRAIFSEEAEDYYKMILNATIKLKGEGNAQSCLEDIELASYSITLLARKFGMEKISVLPEIIESLSYQANKRLVKLPLAIVQGIEEGISLLAIFDHHQPDHKIRFTSILASLKQYYAKTFQTRDVNSVVP
ncbi:MAG TPA: hypothetical protein VGD14_13395 [bacterium]